MNIQRTIDRCILAVCNDIWDNIEDNKYGLYNGLYGKILVLIYYNMYNGNNPNYSLISRAINIGLGKIFHCNSSSYSSGLAGNMCMLYFLCKNDIFKINMNHLNEVSRNILIDEMRNHIKQKYYDFMHGGIGVALPLLKWNVQQNRIYISEFIDFLYNYAEKDFDNNIYKWESSLVFNTDIKGYNLSISHGISSIIIFLSLSYYLNINKHKIKKMINGAVNYIISNELEMKNTALFPNMIFKDYNNIIIKRRLAWCYGDLDIAISLWHAGNALNNQIWKNKSLQIFRSCIELVEEQDLLTEFGICHGTSGIAMIFRRIYLETEELLFKSGYELWFDKTIKKINEWAIGNRERSEKKDFSLLTGLSGILLVIMSIVYNDNQKWDSLFLLS